MTKASKSKKTKAKKKTTVLKDTGKKDIVKELIKKEKVTTKNKKASDNSKIINEEKVVENAILSDSKKEDTIVINDDKIKKTDLKLEKKLKEKKKVEQKQSKKMDAKAKKKILIILVTAFVLFVFLILLIIINKENYSNNISFITKNGMKVSSPWNKFKAPVYSFAIDKKNNPVEIENLTFLDKNITYSFHDTKRDVLEDGNVLITIPCEMEVELEYVVGDDVDTNWIYTYSYAPVFAFDYYSGDIYREKTISDSNLVLMDGNSETKTTKKKKKKEKTEDQMVYTEQVHNDEKISIGILNNSTKSTWGNSLYRGNEEDGKHFVVNNKSDIVIYIKAPKNYDGLTLAINKNGATYDTWKNEYEYYEKLVSLQEEEKKTGEKSNELKKMEQNQEVIHKLLDKNDEYRNNYSKDDFYVIRVADMFKEDYLIEEESDFNLLYVTGILVLTLSVLTCIFMAISERNKAYGKGYYSR